MLIYLTFYRLNEGNYQHFNSLTIRISHRYVSQCLYPRLFPPSSCHPASWRLAVPLRWRGVGAALVNGRRCLCFLLPILLRTDNHVKPFAACLPVDVELIDVPADVWFCWDLRCNMRYISTKLLQLSLECQRSFKSFVQPARKANVQKWQT